MSSSPEKWIADRSRALACKTNERERALRVLDVIEANVAILDCQGVIVSTNKPWRDFASRNRRDGMLPERVGVGTNYLSVCLEATGVSAVNALRVYNGIRGVLDGKRRSFSDKYPCHSPDKQRWFKILVKPLHHSNPMEVVVIHTDITDRWLAEHESHKKTEELNDALTRLQAMAGEIKIKLAVDKDRLSELVVSRQQPTLKLEMLKSLSKREMEVYSGLLRGERNGAMAARLQLSKKSISTYRSRVFDKLKVENEAQLMAMFSSAGAVDIET